MNLYRVVTTVVTEYLVKAETEDGAVFFVKTQQGDRDSLLIVESQTVQFGPAQLIVTGGTHD